MSIKARLVVTISMLVAVAFLAIGGVTVSIVRDRMIERMDETLAESLSRPPRSWDGHGGDGPGVEQATIQSPDPNTAARIRPVTAT